MELVTALREGKPVVMLVGAADETGAFVPNTEMLIKLFFSVDVAQAAATVEEDRVRILGDVQREFGFDKVNTLAAAPPVTEGDRHAAQRTFWYHVGSLLRLE